MPKPTHPYMTTQQVAAYYEVVPSRIRQVCMHGRVVPALKVGGVSLWDRSQLPLLCPRADGSRHRKAGKRGKSRT